MERQSSHRAHPALCRSALGERVEEFLRPRKASGPEIHVGACRLWEITSQRDRTWQQQPRQQEPQQEPRKQPPFPAAGAPCGEEALGGAGVSGCARPASAPPGCPAASSDRFLLSVASCVWKPRCWVDRGELAKSSPHGASFLEPGWPIRQPSVSFGISDSSTRLKIHPSLLRVHLKPPVASGEHAGRHRELFHSGHKSCGWCCPTSVCVLKPVIKEEQKGSQYVYL